MTRDEKIIRNKVGVLELAKQRQPASQINERFAGWPLLAVRHAGARARYLRRQDRACRHAGRAWRPTRPGA